FISIDMIMAFYDPACIKAYGYNDICMLHSIFFQVIYPPSAIWSSSIIIQGMHVQGKWFSRSEFHFYPGKKSHPIMSINNIKLLISYNLQNIFSKKNYLLNNILAIKFSMMKSIQKLLYDQLLRHHPFFLLGPFSLVLIHFLGSGGLG